MDLNKRFFSKLFIITLPKSNMADRRRHSSKKCAFCGDELNGLEHNCKFCGKLHCSKHLIPENHNCVGLGKIPTWSSKFKSRRQGYSYKKSYTSSEQSNKNHKKVFSVPRIRLPKISLQKITKFLILSLILTLIARYSQGGFVILAETISWGIFAYYLYRKTFYKINSVRLSNDLSFFGLKILGVIIILASIYIGFGLLFWMMLHPSSLYWVIPILVLLGGAFLLSAFIEFRTQRRYPHLYVNRDY